MNPGFLCLVVPLGAGAGLLLIRAANADHRATQLGLVSAAAGVAGFVAALTAPAFNDPDRMPALAACGVLTVVLAVTATVLGVWSVHRRRQTTEPTGRYPAVGVACGLANLACGLPLVVVGTGLLVPADGTPWVWRSEADGFQVTVPSKQWILKSNSNVLAQFYCQRPTVMAMVAEVRPAGADAEYEAALAFGAKLKDETPTANTTERAGPNRHGCPSWLYMGDARSADGAYFFGASITRVGDRAVVLLFEAPYQLYSQAGRGQEGRAFRAWADLFLGSVEPPAVRVDRPAAEALP